MEKQSQRCKQIVQNLLRFARSSSREESETVDVNQVMRETISFLSHQMVSSRVDLDLNLAETLPPVTGHSGKMQQVFTNILINSLQAINSGSGSIKVETSCADNWVKVCMTDTGEGIPPENMDKIFEPFFTTKEIGQGTGLGLSVTYGLVRDMGGNIHVDSVVGNGTTFTVMFPAADTREKAAGTPETSRETAREASKDAGKRI
jgi:signal transduction histidine kinase